MGSHEDNLFNTTPEVGVRPKDDYISGMGLTVGAASLILATGLFIRPMEASLGEHEALRPLMVVTFSVLVVLAVSGLTFALSGRKTQCVTLCLLGLVSFLLIFGLWELPARLAFMSGYGWGAMAVLSAVLADRAYHRSSLCQL